MTFNQKLANYVLGNFTATDMPDIAVTGIEEGFESESLLILAGFCKNENAHEIVSYFDKALCELKIELISEKEAAIEIIHFYSYEIINDRIDVLKGMSLIAKSVLLKSHLFEESQVYAYDSIGFETVYGYYDSYEGILYDYIFEEQQEKVKLIAKAEQEIKNELKLWVKNFKTN